MSMSTADHCTLIGCRHCEAKKEREKAQRHAEREALCPNNPGEPRPRSEWWRIAAWYVGALSSGMSLHAAWDRNAAAVWLLGLLALVCFAYASLPRVPRTGDLN